MFNIFIKLVNYSYATSLLIYIQQKLRIWERPNMKGLLGEPPVGSTVSFDGSVSGTVV